MPVQTDPTSAFIILWLLCVNILLQQLKDMDEKRLRYTDTLMTLCFDEWDLNRKQNRYNINMKCAWKDKQQNKNMI